MMDEQKMRDLKKNAKVSLEKNKYDDGYVYSTVNGIKEFFPLHKVKISEKNGKEFKVIDLLKQVDVQNERIDKLVEINKKLLEKVSKLEGKVNTWIG
jgi:hypothetical protein